MRVGTENVFLRLSADVYLTWRIQSTARHQDNDAAVAVAVAKNESLVFFSSVVLSHNHYWQDKTVVLVANLHERGQYLWAADSAAKRLMCHGNGKTKKLLFHTFIRNKWHSCFHFLHNNNKPCTHTVQELLVSFLFSFLLLILLNVFFHSVRVFLCIFLLHFCISFLTSNFIATSLFFSFPFLSSFSRFLHHYLFYFNPDPCILCRQTFPKLR